jgi:hypothetical protein
VLQQPQLAQGKPGQLFLRAAQPLDGDGGGDDQATPSAKAQTGCSSGPGLTPHAGVVPDLALAAGVGLRFVVELEAGKPTVRLELVLRVIDALGGTLQLGDLAMPISQGEGRQGEETHGQ